MLQAPRALLRRLQTALDDPLSSQVLRGSFVSMAVRVAGLAIGFLSHMLISRTLGLADYGQYSVALALALILVIPARLGLDNSVLRFATVYAEEQRFGALRGLIRFALLVPVASSGLIVLTLLAGSQLGLLAEIPPGMLFWIAAMLFPMAALGVFSALIRTVKRIFASQFYEQVLRPSALIAGIALFWAAGMKLTAEGAMMLTVAAATVALLGILIHFRRVLPQPLHEARAEGAEWKDWLALSWPLFLMNIVQEILNQIDILLLGHLATAEAAGLHAAAWRLASLVPFALISLSAISAPLIAWAYRKQDYAELARIARMNARLAFAFSIGMAGFLALVGPFALRLFGEEFEAAYPALLILLLGGLVSAFTGSVGYLMTMTGRQYPALMSATAALACNLILNFTLIPRIGILGSATAATASICVYNLLMWIHVRRTMGIDASVLSLPPRQAVAQ